jgi:hypothetical protein
VTRQQTSPEDVRRIVAHAGDIQCDACGAAPGCPCDRPGSGRVVCKARFVAAVIEVRRQDKAARRTAQQAAIWPGYPG